MTERTNEDEPVNEQVERLLRKAHDAIAESGTDPSPSETLFDLADEANDLVTNSDTTTLLEATDADLPEDADTGSVPEVLAQDDSESLIELRTLLLLSKLSEQGREGDSGVLDELRELHHELSFGEATNDEKANESDADEVESGNQDETAVVADDLESDLKDGLSAFHGELKSVLTELNERLESIERDDSTGEERAEGDDETGARPTVGRGNRLSTLPPSDRADMKQPRRLSTLRDRSERQRED